MVPYSFISYFHDQVKVHFNRTRPVNNIDKRIILTLMVMIFFSSCDKEGIINGGAFISASKDRVSAFYLYDFISMEDVEVHASSLDHSIGRLTASFYFSHNSNIPSQDLRLSKDLQEAKSVIGQYSYNIKYAFLRDKNGFERLVNCMEIPDDDLCDPNNL